MNSADNDLYIIIYFKKYLFISKSVLGSMFNVKLCFLVSYKR